jgi:RHS repeat-associated protein
MSPRRWFSIFLIGLLAAILAGFLSTDSSIAAPPAGHKPRTWIPWEPVLEPAIEVVRSHQAPVPGTNVGDSFWAHGFFREGTFRPGYWAGDPLPATRPWIWMPIKTGNFQASNAATATATYVGQKLWVTASGEYLVPPEPVNSAGNSTTRVPVRKELRIELDLGVKMIRTDSDGDGLWDDWELQFAYAVKPGVPTPADPLTVFSAQGDWDGDGLIDSLEMQFGTNPTGKDTDSDSLADKVEKDAGLNPLDGQDLGRDSDGDGLSDGVERLLRLAARHRLTTVPGSVADPVVTALSNLDALSAKDTDKDGMSDDWEIVWGRSPLVAEPRGRDQDSDGLSDLLESRYRTWPNLPLAALLPPSVSYCDYNQDGVTDIFEPEFKFVPIGFQKTGSIQQWGSVWLNASQSPASFTAPSPQNTDGDNMQDLNELLAGRDPLRQDDYSLTVDPRQIYNGPGTPTPADLNGNGISNDLEIKLGWNPQLPNDPSQDTDGDKTSDGVECILAYAAQQRFEARALARAADPEHFVENNEYGWGDPYGIPEWWYEGCRQMTKNAALDTDGDGLSDSWELVWGLKPYDSDSDGDGFRDDYERNFYDTANGYYWDPYDAQIPNNGMSAYIEPPASPAAYDSDEDYVSDGDEYNAGTYPTTPAWRLHLYWSAADLFCDFNRNNVDDIFEPAFGLMVSGFLPAGHNSINASVGDPGLAVTDSLGKASFVFGDPKNTDGDSLVDDYELDQVAHPGRNPRVPDDPWMIAAHGQVGSSYNEAVAYGGNAIHDAAWYEARAYAAMRFSPLGLQAPQYENFFNNQAVHSDFPRYYQTLYSGGRLFPPVGYSTSPPDLSSEAWSYKTMFSDYEHMKNATPPAVGTVPTNSLLETNSFSLQRSYGSEVTGVGDVMERVLIRRTGFGEELIDNPLPDDVPNGNAFRRSSLNVNRQVVSNGWKSWQVPPGVTYGISAHPDLYTWPQVIGIWGYPFSGASRFHAYAGVEEQIHEFAFYPVDSVTGPSRLTGQNQARGFESDMMDGKHFWKLGVSGASKYKFNFGSAFRVFRATLGAGSVVATFDTGIGNVIQSGKTYQEGEIPSGMDEDSNTLYHLRVELAPGAALGLNHISVQGFFERNRVVVGSPNIVQSEEIILDGPNLGLRTRDAANAPSYRLQLSEDGGSRYRKIGLNGVPLADEKPQSASGESNLDDTTFIDALTLTLSHRSSDLYIPVANSELSISVGRTLHQEKLNDGMKTFPLANSALKGDYVGRPFGLCWDSSLTPHAVLQVDSHSSTQEPDMVTVNDESGASYRFAIIWSPVTTANPVKVPGFLPMPSIADQTSMLNRLSVNPGINYNVQNPSTWELELTKRNGTVTRFQALGSVTDNDPEEGGSTSQATWRRYYFRCKPAVSPGYQDWAVQDRFGNRLYYEYPTTTGPPMGTTQISSALIPSSIFDTPQKARRLVIETWGLNETWGLDSPPPAPNRFVSAIEIREKNSVGAETVLQKVFYNYEVRDLRTDFGWESGTNDGFWERTRAVVLSSVERQAGTVSTPRGNQTNILTKYAYDSTLDTEVSWELESYQKTHAHVWLKRIEDRLGGYYEFKTDYDRSRRKYSCSGESPSNLLGLLTSDYSQEYGLDRTVTHVLQKGPEEATPHLLAEMRLQFDGRGDLGSIKVENKMGTVGPAAVSGERVNAVVDADRRIRFYRFSSPVIRDTEAFRNLFFPPGTDESGMPRYRDRIGLLTWRKMELDHGLGAREIYEFEPEAMMGLKSATLELPAINGGNSVSTTTWKYESVFKPGDFIPMLNGKLDQTGRPLTENPFFCRWYPEPSEERRVLSGSNSLSSPGNGSLIQKRFKYWGDEHASVIGASLKPWARSMVESSTLVNHALDTLTAVKVHETTGLVLAETVFGPDGYGNDWTILQETHFHYGPPPSDPFAPNFNQVPFGFGTKAYMWRKDILRGINDSQALTTVYIPDQFNNVAKTITGNTSIGTVEYTKYNALGQILAKADGRVGLTGVAVPADLSNSPYATRFFYRLDGRLDYSMAPAVEEVAAFPTGESASATTNYFYDLLGRKEKVIEADGSDTRFFYDHYGRVHQTTRHFTDTLSGGSADLTCKTVFSPSGLTASTESPNQLRTLYEYDWLRRVVTQQTVDAGGQVPVVETRMEYSGVNCGNSLFSSSGFQPTKITGPFIFPTGQPAIKTAVYDSLNRKISEQIEFSPGQFAINQWGYDARGNVIVAKNPDGWETKSTYDGMSRATKVTKPDTSSATTIYSGAGLPLRVSQWIPGRPELLPPFPPRTRTTSTSYDIAGRAFEVFLPNPSSLSGQITGTAASRTLYNLAGWVREVQVAKHGGGFAITNTTYDRRGRVMKVEQPLVENFTPPDLGLFPAVAVSQRPTTTTAYDRMNRATQVTHPRSDSSLTVYNQAGQAIRTVTAVLAVSTIAGAEAVPQNRRLVSATRYDLAGNPMRVSTGQTIAESNDAAAYLAGKSVSMPALETPLERGAVRNAYDRRGRLLASTRASSSAPYVEVTESFIYDAAGNRTEIQDSRGQRSTMTYDALARVLTTTHVTGQAGDTTTNFYTATKLLKTVDANGLTTEMDYDTAYRVTGLRYNLVPGVDQERNQNQQMTYNAAGELLRVTFSGAPHRDTAYQYDARSRRTHETSSGLTHRYSYDEPGNLTQVIHGGTLRTLTSTYDALNRLLTCTETLNTEALAQGRVTRYHYDLLGNIRRKALPNGSAEDKVFDAAGRAIGQGVYVVGAAIPERTRVDSAWDAWGNLIWQKDVRKQSGQFDLRSRWTVNAYDHLSRLTEEAIYSAPAAAPESVTSYEYDQANNRTKITRQAGAVHEVERYDYTSAVVTTHLTDAGPGFETQGYAPNQLRRIILDNGTAAGEVRAVFRYDRNGNRTRKWEAAGNVITTYEWDRGNRLVKTTRGGQTWQFTYDHRSRRILRDAPGSGQEQDSYAGGTSANRWNIADGPPLVAPAIGELAVEYVRGSDYGGGVGGVLYTIDGAASGSGAVAGTSRFFEYGARGDVTGQSDTAGASTFRAFYKAFGNYESTGNAGPSRQRASTKDEETELGLLNEGFRYREVSTGVFLSRDPAGFVDGPNLYSYVQQNPWSKFDPDGQFWSALVTVAFAAYDTYQYASGQMSGQEYAKNMAVNGAALAADVLTAGQGGGFAVRAAAIGCRTKTAIVGTARAIERADNIVATVESAGAAVDSIAEGNYAQAAVQMGAAVLTGKASVSKVEVQKFCFAAGTEVWTGEGWETIERLLPGKRVTTEAGDGCVPTAVGADKADPWIEVTFAFDDPFGNGGRCQAVLLRPASEVAAQGWHVGEKAAVDFGPEVKARDGQAVVESIRPAPAPKTGTGRVVTGTFRTWTQDLRELRMEGLAQPVRVTGGHRFQVEAESAWVAVHDLRPGDRIRTLDGTGRLVAGVEPVPGTHQVFNLEVEGVHQYYVSPAGLLTHNNDNCNTPSAQDVVHQADDEVAKTMDDLTAAKTPLNGGNRIDPSKISAPPPARGRAPIGNDGKPIELHHTDQAAGNASPLDEMTRTEHRGAGNFKKNHPNTGQSGSTVDRAEFDDIREQHWEQEWDSGRFDE